MKIGEMAGVSGLRERYPRLEAAVVALAGFAGAVVLLAVLAVVVGFGLGSPGPAGPAPSVDFTDEPATVLAAATERLEHRDYTVEEWVRTVDHRDGSVSGALFYRVHVEATRGQVRGRVQPAGPYGDGAVGDRPVREIFAAGDAGWVRLRGVEYWQPSAVAANVSRDVSEGLNVSRERLAGETVTVVLDNETRFVATVERDAAADDGVDRVRYVIEKGPDPRLREVWYVSERRFETRTRVLRVLNYGEATAPRPADVPWTSVAELTTRVSRGLDRLA